jgi:hypothetical protein
MSKLPETESRANAPETAKMRILVRYAQREY